MLFLGLAQVIVNTLGAHMNLSSAINSPRIYDPLIPDVVQHDSMYWHTCQRNYTYVTEYNGTDTN